MSDPSYRYGESMTHIHYVAEGLRTPDHHTHTIWVFLKWPLIWNTQLYWIYLYAITLQCPITEIKDPWPLPAWRPCVQTRFMKTWLAKVGVEELESSQSRDLDHTENVWDELAWWIGILGLFTWLQYLNSLMSVKEILTFYAYTDL